MTSTQTKTATPVLDQITEVNEQVLSAARRIGNYYVDTYDKAVDSTLELQLKLAGMTRQDWLKELIEIQTGFTREITDSAAAAARNLLA